MASVALLTFTVVAAAMMSPTRPVTAAVASRSPARYRLMRPSSAFVVSTTPASGISSTAAPSAFAEPSRNPAATVNTRPPDTSTMPSTSMAMSSVSSRKWVSASPADPTGCPASGPPLATWAVSRLARSSVCMCAQARVQVTAPKWTDPIRTVSATATPNANQ